MLWKTVSSNLNASWVIVPGIKGVLWITPGGTEEPVGTEMNMTHFCTARWEQQNIPASLSRRAHPPSHITANTSCKASTVSWHESEERSEHITVSPKLPSLLQPRRRWRIITANTVTQASSSPFFLSVSHYVEQQLFHLWPVSVCWVPVLKYLMLYSICYSPVGSYRARHRGTSLSWTAGPLFQVAGSRIETEAAIGIEVYI